MQGRKSNMLSKMNNVYNILCMYLCCLYAGTFRERIAELLNCVFLGPGRGFVVPWVLGVFRHPGGGERSAAGARPLGTFEAQQSPHPREDQNGL